MRHILLASAIAISPLLITLCIEPATAQDTAYDKAYDPKTGTIRLNPGDKTGEQMLTPRDFSKDNRPPALSMCSARKLGSHSTASRHSSGYR